MKIQFGSRDSALIAGILRDAKILAAVRECIANNQPLWVWPIQLRRYQEADIRAVVGSMGGEYHG